jgi:hypothetical protein
VFKLGRTYFRTKLNQIEKYRECALKSITIPFVNFGDFCLFPPEKNGDGLENQCDDQTLLFIQSFLCSFMRAREALFSFSMKLKTDPQFRVCIKCYIEIRYFRELPTYIRRACALCTVV